MVASLETLPAEIINSITELLAKEDQLQLRIASKILTPTITKFAFSDATLYPNDASTARFANIADSAHLRNVVRSVWIYTSDEPYDLYTRISPIFDPEDDTKLPPNFKTAIRSLATFPHLDAVTLQFDPNCGAEDGHWIGEPTETHTFRRKVLVLLFKTLAVRDSTPGFTKIRHLGLINIQNLLPAITSARIMDAEYAHTRTELQRGFVGIMGGLETLKMRVVNEIALDTGSRYHFQLHQPQSFMDDLFPSFFAPCTTLRHLWLMNDMYFGLIPSLPRDSTFTFPNVQTLILENFTFAAEWHLEWILQHKGLRKLVLVDCGIVRDVQLIDEDECEGYSAHSEYAELMPPEEGVKKWRFEARWSGYFDRIREGLPGLEVFGFLGGREVACSERSCVERRRWVEGLEEGGWGGGREGYEGTGMYLDYDERETMGSGEVYRVVGGEGEGDEREGGEGWDVDDGLALERLLSIVGVRRSCL